MASSLALTDAADLSSDGNNVVFDQSGGAIVDAFGTALRTEASPLGRLFYSSLVLTDAPDTLSSSGRITSPLISGSLAITDDPDTLTVRLGGWLRQRSGEAVWAETAEPVGGWTKLNP